MRTRIQFTIALLFPLLLSSVGLGASDQGGEPDKFFREFVGLGNDQIQAIRHGNALAKILDSRTPDEVFVFGSVYINANPESYLKLASDIDALRKLPSFLGIRKFSDPPQLSDLDGFTLEGEDVKQLKELQARPLRDPIARRIHGRAPESSELVCTGHSGPSKSRGTTNGARSSRAIRTGRKRRSWNL
jgi:hypothetical protein